MHRAQESGYNLRDAARQDYLARAKIASKLIKYPNVEDYTVCFDHQTIPYDADRYSLLYENTMEGNYFLLDRI